MYNSEIVEYIIQPLEDVAGKEVIEKLFGNNYIPGTFMFEEKMAKPKFLDESKDCKEIIRETVSNYITALRNSGDYHVPEEKTEEIIGKVVDLFWSDTKGDKKLYETITNQEVSDVTWNCLKYVLTKDKNTEFHVYRNFNKMGKELAISLLNRFNDLETKELIKLGVLAGKIGLDIKEQYYKSQNYAGVGPSKLNKTNIIPLDIKETKKDRLERVYEELEEFMKKPMGIDCRNNYLELTSKECKLVHFTDDYIEGIFDTFLVQKQLLENSDIEITIIPRGGIYGNDLSYKDYPDILKNDLFLPLRNMKKEGTFKLCKNGPKMGGMNAKKISKEVADNLISSDVVVLKGARAFEMVQGLKKPTFFGFNVAREYSESLTGIDSNLSPPVFIYQKSGERTYGDFRARASRRIISSETGRELKVASYTLREYCGRNGK
ncbi:MAG: hypothetical protein KAT37_03205 [Candidatus Aenigmarchaeota archaeon]|nr:hypothetical protein [Candidatus Aenigmarchaeota archaeon]